MASNQLLRQASLSTAIMLIAFLAAQPATIAQAATPTTSATNIEKKKELEQPGKKFLGINFTTKLAYVDVLKTSRFFSKPFDPYGTKNPSSVDAQGWPVEDFSVFFSEGDQAQEVEAGQEGKPLTVVFTGQASVRTSGGGGTSPATITNKVYDPVKNRTTLELTVPMVVQNYALTFENTLRTPTSAPKSGVTDLKIIRPGYDIDNPPLLTNYAKERHKNFRILRMMDVMGANNSTPIVTPENRPSPENRRTKTGVPSLDKSVYKDWGRPIEEVIQIGNETKSDLWINIDLGATDEYIRLIAEKLRDGLDPEIKIYVEYVNELWNYGTFTHASKNRDLAVAEINADIAAGRDPVLALWKTVDGVKVVDPYGSAHKRTTRELVDISNIFRGVFGDRDMMTRVRPVLAMQSQGNWQLGVAFDMMKARRDVFPQPISHYFYAGSVGDYFGLRSNVSGEKDLSAYPPICAPTDWKANGSIDSRGVCTGQCYSVGNVVIANGTYYQATVRHGASSTFEQDLALGRWTNQLTTCDMNGKQHPDLTVDEVITRLERSAKNHTENRIEKIAGLLKWEGLNFFMYEVASDTAGSRSNAAKAAAEEDPRMKEICRDFINGLFEHGADSVLWYHSAASPYNYGNGYGRFGLTNSERGVNSTSPKKECVNEAVAAGKPRVKGHHHVPTTFSSVETAPYDYEQKVAGKQKMTYTGVNGEYPRRQYVVTSETSRVAKIHVSAGGTFPAGYVAIVNGEGNFSPIMNVEKTDLDGKFSEIDPPPLTDSTSVEINLDRGVNMIEIRRASVTGDLPNTGHFLDTITIE